MLCTLFAPLQVYHSLFQHDINCQSFNYYPGASITGTCPPTVHEMLEIVQEVRLRQNQVLASLEIPDVTRTNTAGGIRRRDYSLFGTPTAGTDNEASSEPVEIDASTTSTAKSTRSNYNMFESLESTPTY